MSIHIHAYVRKYIDEYTFWPFKVILPKIPSNRSGTTYRNHPEKLPAGTSLKVRFRETLKKSPTTSDHSPALPTVHWADELLIGYMRRQHDHLAMSETNYDTKHCTDIYDLLVISYGRRGIGAEMGNEKLRRSIISSRCIVKRTKRSTAFWSINNHSATCQINGASSRTRSLLWPTNNNIVMSTIIGETMMMILIIPPHLAWSYSMRTATNKQVHPKIVMPLKSRTNKKCIR